MDYHHHTNNSFDSNAVMEDMQGDVRFKTSEKVHLTSKRGRSSTR